MAYTNNVPQGNQQIATTQPLIQANFGFIQTDLQVDHCFNGNGIGSQAEGTHKQVNLPSQATPSILTGCAGTLYANGNDLFWNSAAGNYRISQPIVQFVLTGTVALTTSSATVIALPATAVGTYYLEPPGGIGAQNASAMGQFVTSGSQAQIATNSDPGLSITTSGLNLQAATTSGALNGTYKYVVAYFVP